MRPGRRLNIATLALAAWAVAGCAHHHEVIVPAEGVPKELTKVTLPPYTIEPPDILYIEVLLPPQDEILKSPYATSLPPQPIQGQFLVRPDGSVGLGVYGSVQVAGLTIDEARERVREFISKVRELDPKRFMVTVDVAAFNSKVYYVITDGAGYGAQMQAFPITGSETVLDALARIGGIPPVGSTKRIWVARRSPNPNCPEQILPVDWCATATQGVTQTNYQVLPGDRIYVQSQKLISVDNAIAKMLAPVERIFGVVLLGSSTVNSIQNRNNFNNTGF